MDVTNLAKIFGPTIVAHAVPDPDPMTLLQDTKRQPKVGWQEELLGAAEVLPGWCPGVDAVPVSNITRSWVSL